MKKQPTLNQNDLNRFFISPIVARLKKEIEQQQALMRKTEEIYLTYHEKVHRIDVNSGISKYINETQWLKTTIHDTLEEEFPEKREITIEEAFGDFFSKTGQYISELDREIIIPQKEHCFYAQEEDGVGLRIKKRIKNSFYQLSVFPKRIANSFRKKKKPIERWNHSIPYQAMVTHYLVNLFVLKVLPYYKELQKLRCEGISIKWSITLEINDQVGNLIKQSTVTNPSAEEVENLLNQIDNIREKHKIEDHLKFLEERFEVWEKNIHKNINDLNDSLLQDLEKVDTIELPKNKFSSLRIKEERKNYKARFLALNNGWRNTLFAQLDDFQVDLELYHITYSSLLQFFLLQQSTKVRTRKTINENIDKIRAAFAEINIALKTENGDENQTVELLKRERRKVKYKLENKIIPEAIEAIYNQNLPYLLDRLEHKVKEQVERMKDQRLIYADHKYNQPISRKDLDHFSPKKLVMIDIFSKFSEKNKKLKGAVVRQIEQLQLDIKELSGIVDFNLDSAINSIKENDEKENINDIALEGIERTQNKVNEVEKGLNKLSELIDRELKENIEEICKRLIALTKTDNIVALKIKMAQAQSIERTKFYREKLLNNIKRFFPLLWRFVRGKIFAAYHKSKAFLEKVGVLEKEQKLNAALSDFLHKTNEAVEKLPYVYRRLYRVIPLEEEVFFEGRREELNQLETAYKSWKSGGLSTCSVVGEKGSGASSLINFFSKGIPENQLIRFKLDKSYSSHKDFISFFQDLLQDENLNSYEEIVEKIQQRQYRCIILEDLQNFYLKRIHGFNAMQLLFELISKTARDVFWIVEVTSYTWSYLEKTLNIQNYFKYNIKLSKLDEEQIIQLIMRRHRVSGYNLKFALNEGEKKGGTRKTRRMSEEEKQEFLKKRYFNHLNNFAESNISLALIYWLRSTIEVDENTIYIGELEEMNNDFVNRLDEISIFTLHALLIHDSLNIKEHATLFHQTEHQSKMILLVLEDGGILEKEADRYTINRLLYRQVVNALYNKNIIH